MRKMSRPYVVGDAVRYKGNREFLKDAVGVVKMVVDVGNTQILHVSWHGFIDGWDDKEIGITDHSGFCSLACEVEPALSYMQLIVDSKNVYAMYLIDGEPVYTAKARCKPSEPFNVAVGSQIALQRLLAKITPQKTPVCVPADTSIKDFYQY